MSTTEMAIQVGRQALMVMFIISAPVLATGLLVGVVVSILQAATQVQEQTLAFVPKILAMLLVIFVLFPWMMGVMVDFTRTLIQQMPAYIR